MKRHVRRHLRTTLQLQKRMARVERGCVRLLATLPRPARSLVLNRAHQMANDLP